MYQFCHNYFLATTRACAQIYLFGTMLFDLARKIDSIALCKLGVAMFS